MCLFTYRFHLNLMSISKAAEHASQTSIPCLPNLEGPRVPLSHPQLEDGLGLVVMCFLDFKQASRTGYQVLAYIYIYTLLEKTWTTTPGVQDLYD